MCQLSAPTCVSVCPVYGESSLPWSLEEGHASRAAQIARGAAKRKFSSSACELDREGDELRKIGGSGAAVKNSMRDVIRSMNRLGYSVSVPIRYVPTVYVDEGDVQHPVISLLDMLDFMLKQHSSLLLGGHSWKMHLAAGKLFSCSSGDAISGMTRLMFFSKKCTEMRHTHTFPCWFTETRGPANASSRCGCCVGNLSSLLPPTLCTEQCCIPVLATRCTPSFIVGWPVATAAWILSWTLLQSKHKRPTLRVAWLKLALSISLTHAFSTSLALSLSLCFSFSSSFSLFVSLSLSLSRALSRSLSFLFPCTIRTHITFLLQMF